MYLIIGYLEANKREFHSSPGRSARLVAVGMMTIHPVGADKQLNPRPGNRPTE